MTDLNGGALFNAEFGIRHRGSTVPERSGVALSFCRRPLIFFSLTLSSSLWIIIDTQDKGLFYALTIFSFSGVIIGLILMRLSTNSILQTSTDLEAVDFFLLVEVTTTFCIVIIAGIAALIFGPDSLIKGFGSGITIAMLIYFSYLYKKQKKSTL
ncbi:hypothetical protein TU85_23370 [Pseudomonas helleri]|nr:hypothetical protein TU85_23370 [Pseudomonas helleri]